MKSSCKLLYACLAYTIQLLSQPLHMRVEVLPAGEDPQATRAAVLIRKGLEAIPGVFTVTKAPDYLISVYTETRVIGTQRITSLAVTSQEVMEDGLANQFFVHGNGNATNASAILRGLPRTDHVSLKVGAAEDIPALCSEIVREIDGSTFERERQNPREAGGFDASFKNLMLRWGARPVEAR